MASGMVLPGSMDGSSDAAYENWGSSEDSNGGVTANMEAGNVSNLPEEWRLRPIQIAATGVLFGALVMAGLRYLPLHSRVANVLNATTSSVSSLGLFAPFILTELLNETSFTSSYCLFFAY
jgi:hypothetical protein